MGGLPVGELTIETTLDGTDATVSLQGYVDAETAPTMRREFKGLYRQGVLNVVVDCTGMNYVSSQGVASLVEMASDLRDLGGDLRLCGLNPRTELVFEHLSLLRFFRIFADVGAAAASFAE